MSSIHAASLPTTAQNGRVPQSALSRITAPPARKHALLWSLLAVVAVIVSAMTFVISGAGTALASMVAVSASAAAVHALRYNRNEYPKLKQLWERSRMCDRCGDIFAT